MLLIVLASFHCGLIIRIASGKLAIRPDHPRRRIEVKVCMPGDLWSRLVSSFIKIGQVVLPLWVVENRPFPITLAIGLYNRLYYRTSRDSAEYLRNGTTYRHH